MKTRKIIITAFITLLLLMIAVGIIERHLVYLLIYIPAPVHEVSCNEMLWKYNAEPEDIIERCIYLSGTVQSVKPEDDGDYNIQLKPDAPYVRLLDFYNVALELGHISIEPICEVAPKKKEFIKACRGYDSNLTMPHKGEHIAVVGAYTHDKHRWTEIHPVTTIEILKN